MAAMALISAVLALATLGLAAAANPAPISVAYNPARASASEDVVFPKVTAGNAAEQVHLAIGGPNAMWVSWATTDAKIGAGIITPTDPNSDPGFVQYGTKSETYTQSVNATQLVYSQIYAPNKYTNSQNYTSPILHHAKLTGLTPNTTYFYRLASLNNATVSTEYFFRSLNAAGPTYPQRLGLIADLGLSENSTATIDYLYESLEATQNPTAILYIGDDVYADTYLSNGTDTGDLINYKGLSESWQPLWDMWGRFLEPINSFVPLMPTGANHEIETQAGNKTFVASYSRYKVPNDASNSSDVQYYSYDVGPAHILSVSPYVNFSIGSPQYLWVQKDLSSVDRTKTPWVIVQVHNPMYTTYTGSYKGMDCFSISIEPLFYQYGVDMVFQGHVHSYERFFPTFNYTATNCAPVYITIGDGGNHEGLSTTFVDSPGLCTGPPMAGPAYLPQVCPTYQTTGGINGYCPTRQPDISAFREPSFGHGTLDILNATAAHWQWHRNQDDYHVVSDDITLTRCAYMGPRTMPGVSSQSI